MEKFPKSHLIEKHKSFQEKARNYIIAATSIFAALMPEGAKAVEFTDTSWSGGLNTIIERVYDSNVEHVGLAIHVPGKVTEWVNGREGSEHDTSSGDNDVDTQHHLDDLRSLAHAAIENVDNGVVACVAHTHPESLHIGEHNGKFLYGPSPSDFLNLLEYKKLLGEFTEHEDERFTAYGLALGRYGGWYFDITDPVQAQSSFGSEKMLDRIDVTGKKVKIILDAAETSPKELYAAIYEFEDMFNEMGVSVRFVTYEEINSEPPCAGPDYVPAVVSNPQ